LQIAEGLEFCSRISLAIATEYFRACMNHRFVYDLASQTRSTPARVTFSILSRAWYWKRSALGLVGSGLRD